MKSLYTFTFVLGTLVMAYWPSLAMAHIMRCIHSDAIDFMKFRAEAEKVVRLWNGPSGKSRATYKGNVASWECEPESSNSLSECSTYADNLLKELQVKQEVKRENDTKATKTFGWCYIEGDIRVSYTGHGLSKGVILRMK
jgi:hypothetical protein